MCHTGNLKNSLADWLREKHNTAKPNVENQQGSEKPNELTYKNQQKSLHTAACCKYISSSMHWDH